MTKKSYELRQAELVKACRELEHSNMLDTMADIRNKVIKLISGKCLPKKSKLRYDKIYTEKRKNGLTSKIYNIHDVLSSDIETIVSKLSKSKSFDTILFGSYYKVSFKYIPGNRFYPQPSIRITIKDTLG